MPISIIDANQRIIAVQACSEHIVNDTQWTYVAAKEATPRWIAGAGNVRRDFDPMQAIGRAVDWWANDAEREVWCLVCISAGAPDTWEAIRRGDVNAGGFGVTNAIKEQRVVNGQRVIALTQFDIAMLGLFHA